MWNTKGLEPPPINSFMAKNHSLDLSNIRTVLKEFLQVINLKNSLHVDAALLSRFIYRLKLRFRSDHGMKSLEKTNKALIAYLNFNITKDIIEFQLSIPKNDKIVYLPTKQMAEYVLVRIQGFSKVVVRVIECALATAVYMSCRLKLGHLWNVALAILAAVSRIWQVCKCLIRHCCTCYGTLLNVRNHLELKGVDWLEPGYVFPKDLSEWLDLPWLQENIPVIRPAQVEIPTLVLSDDEEDDDDIQFCYQYKNDYIVVDDSIHVTDDDVQIVNEYINLIGKRENRFKNMLNGPKSWATNENGVIEIDDVLDNFNGSVIDISTPNNNQKQKLSNNDNSDIEFVSQIQTNSLVNCDDIGEKLSRQTVQAEMKNVTNKKCSKSDKKEPTSYELISSDSESLLIPENLENDNALMIQKNGDTENISGSSINVINQKEVVSHKRRKAKKDGMNSVIESTVIQKLASRSSLNISDSNSSASNSTAVDVSSQSETEKDLGENLIKKSLKRKWNKNDNKYDDLNKIHNKRKLMIIQGKDKNLLEKDSDVIENNKEIEDLEKIYNKRKQIKTKNKIQNLVVEDGASQKLSNFSVHKNEYLNGISKGFNNYSKKQTNFVSSTPSIRGKKSSQITKDDSDLLKNKHQFSHRENNSSTLVTNTKNITSKANINSILSSPGRISDSASVVSTSDFEVDLYSVNSDSDTTFTHNLIKKSEKNYKMNHITSLKELAKFIRTEKMYRDTKNPASLTINLKRKQWNNIIKKIKKIFDDRKIYKQTKREVVEMAKTYILQFL